MRKLKGRKIDLMRENWRGAKNELSGMHENYRGGKNKGTDIKEARISKRIMYITFSCNLSEKNLADKNFVKCV